MHNRYYDWNYYTAEQLEREKQAKWLSQYVTSSMHIGEMERVLEVFRCHRGLLAPEAFTFIHEGIQAMKNYATIEDMKKLESEIKDIINELQQRADKRN